MTDAWHQLIRSIVTDDSVTALRLLRQHLALSRQAADVGATRATAGEFFFDEIAHGMYQGDTALHLAAAAYRVDVVCALIAGGADVGACNRRGASPLHYATDGIPGSSTWNPAAQAAVIRCLLHAGADANATDLGGVTPLHRAVRTRCAAAVQELLTNGADPRARNKSGSTALDLAQKNTGRGGSGSPMALQQREEILRLLLQHLGE